MLAPELEQILQQLYREARKAHYEFISLEHLLLVLIEEDAAVPNVLKLCGADLKAVSEQLAASVAENTPLIPDHLLDTVETRPNASSSGRWCIPNRQAKAWPSLWTFWSR